MSTAASVRHYDCSKTVVNFYYRQNRICAERDILYADNALDFRFPGVGANVFTMAIEGILFFVITLLLEQNFFIHKIAPLLRPPQEEPVEISPNDVRD